MSNGLFSTLDENALYFSRSDPSEIFGTFISHEFELEERNWPTAEHYYQAMKFQETEIQEAIRTSDSPKKARKMGRSRLRKIRKDWRQVKVVFMTRALYTQCKQYPFLSEKLLDTGEQLLVENSQFDYFWGCGRDKRGDNHYGQVLMNVRNKLRQEREAD